MKVIVILSIAKDLKSASKCIHVVVNRSFAMLRMTKKRQGFGVQTKTLRCLR